MDKSSGEGEHFPLFSTPSAVFLRVEGPGAAPHFSNSSQASIALHARARGSGSGSRSRISECMAAEVHRGHRERGKMIRKEGRTCLKFAISLKRCDSQSWTFLPLVVCTYSETELSSYRFRELVPSTRGSQDAESRNPFKKTLQYVEHDGRHGPRSNGPDRIGTELRAKSVRWRSEWSLGERAVSNMEYGFLPFFLSLSLSLSLARRRRREYSTHFFCARGDRRARSLNKSRES